MGILVQAVPRERRGAGASSTSSSCRIQEWLSWAREQVEKQDPIGFGVSAVLADISRVTSWTYRD